MNTPPAPTTTIIQRRFGKLHDQPCRCPAVLECAQWERQAAGECRWAVEQICEGLKL